MDTLNPSMTSSAGTWNSESKTLPDGNWKSGSSPNRPLVSLGLSTNPPAVNPATVKVLEPGETSKALRTVPGAQGLPIVRGR